MGKVLIAGTGRAGTSFLVQLMLLNNLRTGFSNIFDKWIHDKRGGLETSIDSRPLDKLPEVIKDPTLSLRMDELARNKFPIDHVIVPIRDMKEAALSRIQNKVWWDGNPKLHERFGGMENFLHFVLGKLTVSLAIHNIPHTFLVFPKLAVDYEYTWAKLEWLWKRHTNHQRFVAAFEQLSYAHNNKRPS